ncbi:MAG: T9SS type A sorting domain-containing protein [Bacteroidales bacterium]|nr:T9SS type A sorting domain-containing protein [Bacteroidales bacterium]
MKHLSLLLILGFLFLQLKAQEADHYRIYYPRESGIIPGHRGNLPEEIIFGNIYGEIMPEDYLKEKYPCFFYRPLEYAKMYNSLDIKKNLSMTRTLDAEYNNEEDSLALASLYNSTHGDYWKNNTNWLVSPLFPKLMPGQSQNEVESWYGIKVEYNSVSDINLSSNQLTGRIPEDIGNLINLRGLVLSGNPLTGNIPMQIGNLSNLIWLNLSGNNLTGRIPADIGNLSKLQYLNITGNQLIGSLPPEIGNLDNLTSLSLSGNRLAGNIPSEIGNLSKLQRLFLSGNELTGSIPSEIGNLSNLRDLTIVRTKLSGKLPPELGNLSGLRHLTLARNQLAGSIPPGIATLNNLEALNLSDNRFAGNIPSELSNLSSLSALYLDANQFNGSVPSEISNLINLRVLNLDDNQITGLPDLSSLLNLSSCDVSNNNLDFHDLAMANIPKDICRYAPQAFISVERSEQDGQISLEYTGEGSNNNYQWYNGDIRLNGETSRILTVQNTEDGAYYCKATNESFPALTLQTVPAEVENSGITKGVITGEYEALVDIYNTTGGDKWDHSKLWLSDTIIAVWPGVEVDGVHVTGIDINDLTGNIGSVFEDLSALDSLVNLSLGWQSSEGNIPGVIGELKYLESLILMGDIHGNIPAEIGMLSNLNELKLLGRLSGNIPPAIGNLSQLKTLDLTGNQLTGSIPVELGSLSNLVILHLQGNQLSSIIPPTIAEFSKLRYLRLSRNQLSGSLPPEIGNLNNLEWLAMEDNQFTGEIPPEIGNLNNLKGLSLWNNQLKGAIPPELGNLTKLQWLDLSNNRLNDSIPAEISNLNNLGYFRLHGNKLTGNIPPEFGNLSRLFLLDLAENRLTGSIPGEFSNLNNIRLLLQNNNLDKLPELSAFTKLRELNVQNNQLTFEDIEPNVNAGINWLYSPQKKVDSVQNYQLGNGESKILSVTLGGADNRYHWYKDNTLINGATNDTLIIGDFSEEDEGIYKCKIYNTVVPGLELVSHPITLSSSPFYTATFNIEDTANALEGAEINIHSQTLITDTTGKDSLRLPNGEHPYTINASDFKELTGSLTIANEDITKDIVLEPKEYPLIIHVFDGGSQPITQAAVTIQDDTVSTDQYGFATFYLTNGTYSYHVTTDEYGDVSGEAEVRGRAGTVDVAFELDYKVTFKVTEENGPVEEASIEINGQMLTTNADGEASIVLGNGQYTYEVTAKDYQSVKSSIIVAYSEMTEEVILSPVTYLVTFTVTDGTNPVEGATITIDDSELTTDAEGEDTIHLADGEYEYTVTAEGYEDFTNSLTVSGADIDEEITLTATGIDQVELHDIKVYPNPASVIVFIETQGVNSVELVNIEGKVVIEKEVNDAVTILNINQVNAGIYFLHLYIDNGKRHIEKLLIH